MQQSTINADSYLAKMYGTETTGGYICFKLTVFNCDQILYDI